MSGEVLDDYGNPLYSTEQQTVGNTLTTVADQNFLDANNPAGNTSNNYVQPGAYTMDASGKKVSDIYSGLKQLVSDNKGWITAAGALGSVFSRDPSADKKTGYQGTIPLLSASRSMIAAPPTRAQGYRPGAGGIDYGGDVTYALAPGQNPWANLSGTSGSAAGANLTTVPGGSVVTTPGGLNTVTVPGGTKTTTVTGGGGNDTITGGGGNDKITKVTPGSAGYQWATQRLGWTPQQYLNSINQWIIDNPRATKDQIAKAMSDAGVSATDLQTALGQSNFSNATKYALTHGMSLQDMNQNIEQWLRDHPYATNDEIQAAMNAKNVQINDEDIARAMYGLNSSAAKEYAVVHDMGLDKLYQNILDYQAAGHTPEEIAAAMAATGVEQRDINAAAKYAADTG